MAKRSIVFGSAVVAAVGGRVWVANAAAASSIWVLDLHGPRVLDNLKGATIWRLDPSRLEP